jgi:hypothetical protein
MDTVLAFGKGEVLRRSIYLSAVTVLDSVKVTGRMRDPGMDDFDTNRKLGLGHFYTRADIAKFDNLRTSDFLAQTSGMTVIMGNSGKAWVANAGRASSLGRTTDPKMSREDRLAGAKPGACYSTVYLDDVLVFSPGRKGGADLFDINSIPPSSIEAIEYYAGASSIPPKYMRLDTACGVIVIHTKR